MIATKKFFLFLVIFVLALPHTALASIDTAKSICVMNIVTGSIVYNKDENTRKPMASTTKIMTLIVALENSKPDDIVTVSRFAAYQEGSSAYTKPNAKITMRDLCYGLMLNSGNDAAVAIAEHISGDAEGFAQLMNKKAKEIGADDTHFVNPNGLHDDEHYTTAADLAKITCYGLKNELFRDIVSCKMYTSHMTMPDGKIIEVEYINHNRLLKEQEDCIGVKTGFTKTAGRCLVSAVNSNGAQYVVVTLNDSDDWKTHKDLYDMTIDAAQEKKLIRKGVCIKHVGKCDLVAEDGFSVFTNGEKMDFEIINNIPDTIDFPLNKGEKIGYIEIKANNKEIGTVNVVAKSDFVPDGETKAKNCFWFTMANLLRNIL